MGISKKEALQAIEREREMICAASDAVWDLSLIHISEPTRP